MVRAVQLVAGAMASESTAVTDFIRMVVRDSDRTLVVARRPGILAVPAEPITTQMVAATAMVATVLGILIGVVVSLALV